MNKSIGVIFDFNGTMFFDSDKHEAAWRQYIEELSGTEVSTSMLRRYIHGRNSRDILEHFIGSKLSNQQILQFCEEKEAVYRSLCVKDKSNLKLAPGLVEFLDYLKKSQIPVNIATAANWENIQFYFNVFDLYRWFDIDKVVYDNGTLKGKPYPDVYDMAIKNIDMEPRYCLVFEDAPSGQIAARAAGVDHIIIITGDSSKDDFADKKGIVAMIEDYTKLDSISLD